MKRRDFLGFATVGLVVASTTAPEGGGGPVVTCGDLSMKRALDGRGLMIDGHVHLLSAHDVDGGEYVMRRILNLEESFESRGLRQMLRHGISEILDWALHDVPKVGQEKDLLVKEMKAWVANRRAPVRAVFAALQSPEQRLCFQGISQHHKLPIDNLIHKFNLAGFVASRLKNAADLMAANTDIHLFTPIMVDFYEGLGSDPGDQLEEARFYALLNLASRGRFLPYFGFAPERQVQFEAGELVEPGDNALISPLDRLHLALRDWGFIGLKLHPSSGFVPYDNPKYACLNSQDQDENFPEIAAVDSVAVGAKFRRYDAVMEEAMLVAMAYDAPVFTHGKPTQTANRLCYVHGRRDDGAYPPVGGWQPKYGAIRGDFSTDWGGSPVMWARTILLMNKRARLTYERWARFETARVADRPKRRSERRAWELRWEKRYAEAGVKAWHGRLKDRKLRICVAHLAGGYRLTPESDEAAKAIARDAEGNIVVAPTSWMRQLSEPIGKYADMLLTDPEIDPPDVASPMTTSLLEAIPGLFTDIAEMSELFDETGAKLFPQARAEITRLMQDPGFRRKTVYGSDWHLPGSSRVGGAYLAEMKEVLPQESFSGPAIALLGLDRDETRARLERFYRSPPGSLMADAFTPDETRALAVHLGQIPWWDAIEGKTKTMATL